MRFTPVGDISEKPADPKKDLRFLYAVRAPEFFGMLIALRIFVVFGISHGTSGVSIWC
jgi:hypothetical protein